MSAAARLPLPLLSAAPLAARERRRHAPVRASAAANGEGQRSVSQSSPGRASAPQPLLLSQPYKRHEGGGSRSRFRELLAASAQATADVTAFESWAGRTAMILVSTALLFEGYEGGRGLYEGIDSTLFLDHALLLSSSVIAFGATTALALLPSAITALASTSRSALSRSLTSSILLVQEDSKPLKTLAEDLFQRSLARTIDSLVDKEFVSIVQHGDGPGPGGSGGSGPGGGMRSGSSQLPAYVRSAIMELEDDDY